METLTKEVYDEVSDILNNQKIKDTRKRIFDAYARHWLLNDSGHRETHFHHVFVTGVYINKKLDLGFDDRAILLASYFHDLFSWSRNNHADLASLFFKQTDSPVIQDILDEIKEDSDEKLSVEQLRKDISIAIFYHNKKEDEHIPKDDLTPFTQLTRAADKGIPCSNEESIEDRFNRAKSFASAAGIKGNICLTVEACNYLRLFINRNKLSNLTYYKKAFGKDKIKEFEKTVYDICDKKMLALGE